MSTKTMFRSILVIGLAAAASFAVALSAIPISPTAEVSTFLASTPTFLMVVPIVLASLAIAALVAGLDLDLAGTTRSALVRIRTYRERILQRKPYLLTV